MNNSFSNFQLNLDDSEDFPNTQCYENSSSFFNPTQAHVTENSSLQTSQIAAKQPRGNKWDVDKDIALMSSWFMASEDNVRGKNKKKKNLWIEVKKFYDAAQAENPEKLGVRNDNQLKGRFKRLSENASKWHSAYKEAYRQKRSGKSDKDVENLAHKIYEQEGNKFMDYVVFNEVMCKHPRWDLQNIRNATRSHPECEVGDEESANSTKRTRTTEEGGYCVNSNSNTPTSGGSTIQRPIGKDEAKKRGKSKVSEDFTEQLRVLNLTRHDEIEFMKTRLEFDNKKEERKRDQMQLMHLNTLLQKPFLSPEDENMKRYLMKKFYGSI